MFYCGGRINNTMEEVYFQQQLSDGINLYLLRETKFKTVSINIFLYKALDKNTAKNALLPFILKRGNADYPDTKAIERFLGKRYGASLNADVMKKGDVQVLYLNSSVISDKYTLGGEGVVADVLEFLISLVTRPLLDSGSFREEYFVQEKENLKKLIASRINDKIQYSIERCYEEMCKGHPFSRYRYGSLADIEDITPDGLARYYQDVITRTPMDIFVVGDVDIPDIRRVLDTGIEIDRSDAPFPTQQLFNPAGNGCKEVLETMDVSQGKLTMGYSTGVDYNDDDYVPMMVYSSVLGGGAHSKLFNNVREKASLAYYSFARLEKFKGLMIIGSGIEISDYEKAVEIINRQLEDMRRGNISDNELMGAKKALTNDLLAMKDSQSQTVDFLVNRILSKHNRTPEQLIEEINTVTVNKVSEMGVRVIPVIKYFLTSNDDPRGGINDGQ
jgi:predicted Zn-dependent peptidase